MKRKANLRSTLNRGLLGIWILFVSSVPGYCDRIFLSEDRWIEGLLIREDTGTVSFQMEGAGLWTLSKNSLLRVEKENPGSYWMRVGEKHALGNRLERARKAFQEATKDPSTQSQATQRLQDLLALEQSLLSPADRPSPTPPVTPPPVVKTPAPEPQNNSKPLKTNEPSLISKPVEEHLPLAETPVESTQPEPSTASTLAGKSRVSESQSVKKPVDSQPTPKTPAAENPTPPVSQQQTAKVVEKKPKPNPSQKSLTETDNSLPVPKKLDWTGKASTGPRDLNELVRKTSQKYGVDPLLVHAIISVESNWNPKAVSSSGAKGLMQLMPDTASKLGVKDPFDPEQNIEAGIKHLARLHKEYENLDWEDRMVQVLAAYHAGLGKMREVGDYKSIPATKRYLDKVLTAYTRLRERKIQEVALLQKISQY